MLWIQVVFSHIDIMSPASFSERTILFPFSYIVNFLKKVRCPLISEPISAFLSDIRYNNIQDHCFHKLTLICKVTFLILVNIICSEIYFDINMIFLAFFCVSMVFSKLSCFLLVSISIVFFYPVIFSQFVFLSVKSGSCKQHIFTQSGVFGPFTSNVIIICFFSSWLYIQIICSIY